MKVNFLGTGTSQGVPVIACKCPVCRSVDFRDKRLRSSIHIETNDLSLVVDTGPDFRQQMLRENIEHVDGILYTHAHKDHTAGLDDVRSFNFKQKMDIPIYGTEQVIDQLRTEFAYVFAEIKYPGVPQIDTNIIENKPFNIHTTEITPVQVLHHKMPVFGFRIADFTYITDANYVDEIEKEKIKNSKYLVINALQIEPHISHFNLEGALQFVEEMKPEKAFLTHISHKLGKHRDVSLELPENVELAFDGLKLEW